MSNQFSRTQLLYGSEKMEKLAASRVAVFGIGGVGGYVVEALARSGIGALDLIDDDRVCLSNINRQIIATMKTMGQYKVDAARERVASIAPDCVVRTYKTFFLPSTREQFDFRAYDYVVDAIDTVTGKLAIIECAKEAGVPMISSMGAGNKVHASMFEVADIYETSVCPLAKVMRRECKKRGIESLKVVYSKEKPLRPLEDPQESQESREGMQMDPQESQESREGMQMVPQESQEPREGMQMVPQESRDPQECLQGHSRECLQADPQANHAARRSIPGSTAFVPSVVGLIIAGEIVNDLTGMP